MATEKSTAVATTNEKTKLVAKIADRFGVDQDKMLATLKSTAFRQRDKKDRTTGEITPAAEVTNEQMMALLIVADQYGLNPFTKEIYAFPSDTGIVAIVGVDGWIRIINERPELKSISFEYAPEGTENPWISCIIERHDRNKPTEIREYLEECIRDTAPWKSHPRRMLRHKALIQCARVAFGFAGIYEPDEGERFASAIDVTPPRNMKPATRAPEAIDTDAGANG